MSSYIPVSDATLYEGIIYFYISITKELYSLNVDTEEIESLGVIPGETYDKNESYLSIIGMDNSIFFVPYDSEFMPVYNIKTKNYKRIDVPGMKKKCQGYIAYATYMQYLFLFNTDESRILRYDTKEKHFDEVTGWYSEAAGLIFNNEDAFFRQQSVTIGENIYIPFANANAMLRISPNTMETEIIKLGKEENGYSGICYYNDELWCSPRAFEGYVSVYSLENGSIREYKLCGKKTGTFAGITSINDISLYPTTIFLDSDTPRDITIKNGAYAFVHQYYDKECVLFFDRETNQMGLVGRDKYKYIDISKTSINARVKERYEQRGLIFEDSITDVNAWVSFACGD